MKREILPNGSVKLTSPYGFIDIRTKMLYSEVICSLKDERFYKENNE